MVSMADAKICLEHALIYRVALFPIDVGRLVTFFILGEGKNAQVILPS